MANKRGGPANPQSGTVNFGNDYVSFSVEDGPTPTGNQDYSEVFSSEISGTVEYSGKGGFGIDVAVEGTYNRATGDTDFTIGIAAGLAGSVSGTIGADGTVGVTGGSGGVGGIFGVFVDTPFGGIGAAAEGTAGLTSEDGTVHVGAIGQASAGILTIDATATAQAGASFDFGSLSYQEAMTPTSGSARVPQSVIDKITGGLGVRIPHGYEFNQLDQLAEIGRTSPSEIPYNSDYVVFCHPLRNQRGRAVQSPLSVPDPKQRENLGGLWCCRASCRISQRSGSGSNSFCGKERSRLSTV